MIDKIRALLRKTEAAVIFVALFALPGCGQKPPANKPPEVKLEVPAPQLESGQQRFVVQLASTFRDDLAYGGKRGVYRIMDRQTRREYIGVSGIGIAELGKHTETHVSFDGEELSVETETVKDER